MLKIESLSYRYQSRTQFTLENINLELDKGEMLLLAGCSGCGKSTLIKAISGLLNNNEKGELKGKIFLCGEDITEFSPEKIGVMVGTVYQSPDDQLFAMNVADEVAFALENQGVDPEEVQRKLRATLQMVGLAGFDDCSIHKLSGGQRQRLALASVLITNPYLLILDEPFSQMNPQGIRSFMELLLKLNKDEQIAILMIEHRVNELAVFFNRLAVMQAGKMVYDGKITEAWRALDGQDDMGLRKPQSVKLCSVLKLSQLTADKKLVACLINAECLRNTEFIPKHEQKIHFEKNFVEAKNIAYQYPGESKPTIQKINFALQRSQITALMGSNGAGKSTLFNLLGGLTKSTEGCIFLDEKPIQRNFAKTGYLRQEHDLMLLADTAMQELCWKNKHITKTEAQTLLLKLNLQEYEDDFPLALSKGQRLRLVLGAILAKNPQLLLLDEPTTGQDEQSLSEIKSLLLDFKNNGGCVFFCTHDLELASEIADKVILLNDGKIIADADTNIVLSDKELLIASGLTISPLLDICEDIAIPLCITTEEVRNFVCTSAVGRI